MSDPLGFCVVLHGAPRTKKTSNRIVRVGKFSKVLPSLAFEEWNKLVQPQLAMARAKKSGLPFTDNVNVKALVFREKNLGDAVGFYQALADALEEGGIVENDRQIVSWDGSRLLKDSDNPRIIVTVEAST